MRAGLGLCQLQAFPGLSYSLLPGPSNFPFPLVSLKPHFPSFASSPSVHPGLGTG